MLCITEKLANELVDFIKPNRFLPPETAESILRNQRGDLVRQLVGQKIRRSKLGELKEEMRKHFIKSQISPAESVGIFSAMAVGEFQTQSTLNTFHFAGQLEQVVQKGVPRTNELLNASHSPNNPTCKVFFKARPQTIDELRRLTHQQVRYLTFGDLIEAYTIEEDLNLFVTLNRKVMFSERLTPRKVAQKIAGVFNDIYYDYAPMAGDWVRLIVDFGEIGGRDASAKQKRVFIEDVVLNELKQVHICGVEGISNVFYNKTEEQWYAETMGSNFQALLGSPLVDAKLTYSNHLWQVYEVLGIEACRQFMIEEFKQLMSGINECHVALLVDRMTFGGTIASITRYTLRGDNCGPLTKASFEESMDNFINAAANCDVENVLGVSPRIILGARAKVGTGFFDTMVDINMLQRR